MNGESIRAQCGADARLRAPAPSRCGCAEIGRASCRLRRVAMMVGARGSDERGGSRGGKGRAQAGGGEACRAYEGRPGQGDAGVDRGDRHLRRRGGPHARYPRCAVRDDRNPGHHGVHSRGDVSLRFGQDRFGRPCGVHASRRRVRRRRIRPRTGHLFSEQLVSDSMRPERGVSRQESRLSPRPAVHRPCGVRAGRRVPAWRRDAYERRHRGGRAAARPCARKPPLRARVRHRIGRPHRNRSSHRGGAGLRNPGLWRIRARPCGSGCWS